MISIKTLFVILSIMKTKQKRGGSKVGARVAPRRTTAANLESAVLRVRQANNWTQKQMAAALGVSSKQVGLWEKTNSLPNDYEPRKRFETLFSDALTN